MLRIVTDPEVLAGYLRDASNLEGRADALVRPRDVDDVQEAVAWARDRGLGLTCSGGRTSTTGSASPSGGLVLSTQALRGWDRLADDRVRVGAGLRLGDVAERLRDTGWAYPPDPTSWRSATVGATVATNASGARSFAFGPTRAWIESLTLVDAQGRRAEVETSTPLPDTWTPVSWAATHPKSVAGYAASDRLLDVLVGSEGTLAIVTQVTLRLRPVRRTIVPWMAWFTDVGEARAFVAAVRAEAVATRPLCLEWFDRGSLALLDGPDAPPVHAAAVAGEDEGDEGVDALLDRIGARFTRGDGSPVEVFVALDPSAEARWATWRHAVPARVNERMARRGLVKVGTDFAVPADAGDAMFRALGSVPMEHVLFGHVGDEHLHLNLLPADRAEHARAVALHRELADVAIGLGGTVSAEHGIGKLKRDLLERMVGPARLDEMRALRRAADPEGLLGRGNLFEMSP